MPKVHVVWAGSSFYLLNNCPIVYVCVCVCIDISPVCVHASDSRHRLFPCLLLWLVLQGTLECAYLFEIVISSFSLYSQKWVRSCGNSMFNFEKSPYFFLSGCTDLHSHWWYAEVPFFPQHPHWHLYLYFLIIAFLTGVSLYLILILVYISLTS